MTKMIRWGIMGCRTIARAFTTALSALPGAQAAAAGSATPGKARLFAEPFGIKVCHEDHESLAAYPNVDIAVYIVTTHNFHYIDVLLCLEHGKSVLCEKPLTVHEAQTRELFTLAARQGLFLMEALWTRCLRTGLGQSPLVNGDTTCRVFGLMDGLRREWSLRYPGD